jgi:hypothetical protein
MSEDREQSIRHAVERVIVLAASGETALGAGGLFELAYPLVAADVPDAIPDEVQDAFARVWGINRNDRSLYQNVLAVCDRHDPREDESIREVLQRASLVGDLEAAYLLSLTANI